MPTRFTAYIKYQGKEIGFYIVQEGENWDKICATIHAIDGEAVVFSLCRINENDWKTIPQTLPQWVTDLQPLLIAYLEKKFY